MRRFNILTLMMGATISLTACSATDDAILGSRDDIIIMNNGVPVEGSKVASVTEPAAPEMMAAPTTAPTAPATPNIEADAATDAAMTSAAVTAATTENISEIDAEVAAAAEAVAKAERELAAAQGLTEVAPAMTEAAPVVTEAQNVDVAPMKEAVETKANEAVASIEQPVEDITQVKMSKPEARNTQTAAPVMAPEQMISKPDMAAATSGKVEGGCYKEMLIPAVIDASGKVTTLPKVEERRIICPNKMNDGMVAVVQKALMSKGYNVKKADGKFGSATSAALEAYQRDNGLGIGGFTYETMQSLGIK